MNMTNKEARQAAHQASNAADESLKLHHSEREFELVHEAVCTYRLSELPQKLMASLRHVQQRFYLPRTVRVSRPEMVMPSEGRIYLTDYYEIEQRLVEEHIFKAYLGDTDPGRVGGHALFLAEVFERHHRTGEYRQVGWALMTKSQYQVYLDNVGKG